MSRRLGRHIAKGVISTVLALAAPSLPAADVYTITDLGANIYPLSITESGRITGIDTSTTPPTAVIYANGTATPLRSASYAQSINENGLAVGYEINQPDNRALLWNGGQLSSELAQFPNLLEARDISSFDEVVGALRSDSGTERAFRYDIFSGTLTTLATLGGGTSRANAINDRGQITGTSSDTNNDSLAYRHGPLGIVNLSSFEGYDNTEGLDINENNDVVGVAFNRDQPYSGKRAFYAPLNSGIFNIGTLNHDVDSTARGINNSGIIVGQSVRANGDQRAFIFDTASSDVLNIVVDPSNPQTIYTGSSNGNGIARSVNRGQDWIDINSGLVNLTINDITVHPTNSNILYAATQGGIFISRNRGTSWSLLHEIFKDVLTYVLHINEADHDKMYVGSNQGIFYSRDGGASWTRATGTQTYGSFEFVTLDTDNASFVYAATTLGLYRSANEGETWDQQNGQSAQDGQEDTRLFNRFLTMLALDPNESGVLYAATRGGGVYRATNITESVAWTRINLGLNNQNINDLVLDDTTSPSTLYAASNDGFYRRTTAEADEWERLREGGTFSIALAREATRKTLYVTTLGSIFRSDDDTNELGTSWSSVTPGSTSSDVYTFQLIQDVSNNQRSKIFAGTANGIYSSSSNSAAADTLWTIADSGTSGFKITTIAADPNVDPPRLWAGATDQGVYISSDGGQNWINSNNGLNNLNIQDLVVDNSTTPAIVYAATLGGVYVSTNGGASWSALNNGLASLSVYSLALDTSTNPDILYAGTADGVFRSGDQGRNWVPVNIGLQDTDILDLVLNPDDPAQILAASGSAGLFRSLDRGLSWESLNNNSTVSGDDIFDIDQHPVDRGTFLVATKSGVHRISDAFGAWSWEALNSGMETETVFAVAYNPDDTPGFNEFFAGVDTNGAFKSEDGGVSWTAMSEGLESITNQMIALDTQMETPGWQLRDATAIDNLGHIIGSGLLNGQPHGFLLTPNLYFSDGNPEPVVPRADLKVEMVSIPETLKANVPMNFEITLTNQGPDSATGIYVTNWLPPNALHRHIATSQGACQQPEANPPLFRCNIGALNVGDSVSITISVEPQEAELQLRNIVSVKANERDPDFSNNTAGQNQSVTIDRCFIATAAYGSFLHPHVSELRAFRDAYLLTHPLGRWLVDLYYQHSPPLAAWIAEHDTARGLTRLLLAPLVYAVVHPIWAALGLILLLGYGYARRRRRLQGAPSAT